MFGRLLEMSAPEVEDEVLREVDDNPALEVLDPSAEALPDPESDFNETAEELQRADYASSDDVPFYSDDSCPRRSAADPGFDPMSIAEAEDAEEGSLNAAMTARASGCSDLLSRDAATQASSSLSTPTAGSTSVTTG